MSHIPTNYQKRMLWNAITGVSMLVLVALVVLLIWLGAEIVSFLQPVLIPIAVAGIIAFLLEPIVRLLLKRGFTRLRAVILVFLGFFLFLSATAAIILPRTYVQASELIGQRERIVEAVKSKVLHYFQEHPNHVALEWLSSSQDESGKRLPSKAEAWVEKNAGKIAETAWSVLARGFQGFASVLGITIGIFLIPIYLWFFLIESQSIQRNWESFIPLRASKFKREIVETLREINHYLIAFFRGQMLVSMIDGFLVGIALTIFDVPYGLLFGVFVALLGLLPYVGNLLCWLPAVFISIAHFSMPENQHAWLGQIGTEVWIYPVIVTILFVGVQQINSFVTAPKIVGDSVGLHPMTVIFSVFFWTLLLGGALGTLLAVPLSASVKVIFSRYIWAKNRNDPQLLPEDSNENAEDASATPSA